MVTIYALVDPRDNAIRYVGQSTDVNGRFRQHLSNSAFGKKRDWIMELRRAGMRPELRVLETVSFSEADESERRHIASLIDQHADLLNICVGGAGIPRSRAAMATPSEWIAFGNQVKRCEAEIRKMLDHATKVIGCKAADQVFKLLNQIGSMKSKFEDEMFRRRGWRPESGSVFYGAPLEVGSDHPVNSR